MSTHIVPKLFFITSPYYNVYLEYVISYFVLFSNSIPLLPWKTIDVHFVTGFDHTSLPWLNVHT